MISFRNLFLFFVFLESHAHRFSSTFVFKEAKLRPTHTPTQPHSAADRFSLARRTPDYRLNLKVSSSSDFERTTRVECRSTGTQTERRSPLVQIPNARFQFDFSSKSIITMAHAEPCIHQQNDLNL